MSEANVEIVKELFAAWERRDPQAAVPYLAAELEIDTSELSFLGEGSGSGREGMSSAVTGWLEGFENLEWDPNHFIDAGESVIVWLRASGRGRESKAPFEATFAVVYTLRDGMVIRFRAFDTLAAAAAFGGI